MDEKIKKVCRKFFVPRVEPISSFPLFGTKTADAAYRSMLFFACYLPIF